jgi:hypothetical protein
MFHGPNSEPPNISAISYFGKYVDPKIKVIDPTMHGEAAAVEAEPQAEAEFVAKLRKILYKCVWESCQQYTSEPKQRIYVYP